MTKTVPTSKFQEWKGLDRISQVVHAMRCIFREITKDDFGIDGEIEVVVPKKDGQGYEATGGVIKVQAKSGESYVKQDSPAGFVTPVDRKDIEYWHRASFPVVFMVYHPRDDKLYWKDIKAYVCDTPSVLDSPLRIEFDKAKDEFSPDCYSRICGIAEVSPPRISHRQREKLYSNLLPVRHAPRVITHAPTTYREYADLKANITGLVPPFHIADGRLYTLSDLRDQQCVLRGFCDTSHVGDLLADTWIADEARRRDYVFLLNQLLGIHLRRCGLRYTSHFQRNYFPRQNTSSLVFRRSWFNVRTGKPAPHRIVAKYYEYGVDRFWRHLAAHMSFRLIGSSWYLQIIPKYFFTTDGTTPWDSVKVGPYTTKIKASERNLHVLNHVLFWADVLSENNSTTQIELDLRVLMVIEKEPLSGIAHFAIPEDPAIYDEPDESGQLDFLGELFSGDEEREEYEHYY